MAIPNTSPTKVIALASDGWKRTAFPNGTLPVPTAPPEFTTSFDDTSITATITNANGAESYNVRVDAGPAVAGLTVSGLSPGQTYSFQVQGVTPNGTSSWSDAVSITTSGGSLTLPSANMVVDTLESADFSSPDGPSPALNIVGFDWYSINACSIVRDDGFSVHDGTSQISNGPFPDSEWENGPGFSGSHSMRARYAAGREMTEISFRFASYHTDLWIRRWVRVPINFTHGGLNNKWFSIFPTRSNYDEAGTLTVQTRPDGSGGANVVYQDGGVTVGEAGSTPYITVPGDRGRWMQIVYRIKRASGSTANDGIFQHWRRWEGEGAFTLIHSKLDAQLFNTTDPNGFKEGYVFGWANDPYDVDTEFLMDDFEVSSQPLVPEGTEGL